MRALLAACALAAAFPVPALAQDALAPLAFAQGCWRGAFAGAAGMTDERCIEPMLGGKYLSDTHTVRGGPAPYSGESIYAFDVETQRITYVYFASDGGGARGSGAATEEGVTFSDNRYVGPGGSVMHLRSTWIRNGDGFSIVTDADQNGRWSPLMRIDYARAPDLTAPVR